jgi:hypothetical protein
MAGEHDESAGSHRRAVMQMVPRSVAEHDAPASDVAHSRARTEG